MSAVWFASRAAVRRRKLQTFVIGLVVCCATATVAIVLALFSATAAPFDHAYAAQRGAHVVAAFDAAKTSSAQLAATAGDPGVAAAAGPFGQAVVTLPAAWLGFPPGPVTVVGRADPGGPVDRVQLLSGRWATAPGEVVVNIPYQSSGSVGLGSRITPVGAPPLTVVGFASSMSGSAGAWVTPEQVRALHPDAWQMLYRFHSAATEQRLTSDLAAATTGLPGGSLTSSRSYLALKKDFAASADSYLPVMTVFGVLGLLVSMLITGNVVSGAVVSGQRHIGVLKSLGFTPNQVLAGYLLMVSVPAVAGCLLGTLIGYGLSIPLLSIAFAGVPIGTATLTTPAWVPLVCLLAMPVLVALAALLPALRAHRLSAVAVITAGSAPRPGRALRIQRALGASRLPRPVSLGLGQPFARPVRSALTMAAIVLGVATVTLTTGITNTLLAAERPAGPPGAGIRVDVSELPTKQQPSALPTKQQPSPLPDEQLPSEPQTVALLAKQPGEPRVTPHRVTGIGVVGQSDSFLGEFYGGDDPGSFMKVTQGRAPNGPNEVVAGSSFLQKYGLRLGDRITLTLNGRQLPVTIVGEPVAGESQLVTATWAAYTALDPDTPADEYRVTLARGADAQAFIKGVEAADPHLHAAVHDSGTTSVTTALVGFATVFSVLLAIVAALGVLNTVLLSIRDRRRDYGMLRSIGMTPGQVVAMTLTSVTGLGLAGALLGIPLGMAAHRLIADHAQVLVFSNAMKDVWHPLQLAGLALAGVAIAVLGALPPARSAARQPIATVLHGE